MSQNKLTTEEMQQINDIQNKNKEIVFKFGQIEMSIIQLNKAKNDLSKEMEESINSEKQLAEQFRLKYGNGNINIETGEFTPIN